MKKETLLTQLGRNSEKSYGTVNPPIYQTSTVLFPTLDAYLQAEKGRSYYYSDNVDPFSRDLSYAITGTPTTESLATAIATLEGGDQALIVPSGLAAIIL